MTTTPDVIERYFAASERGDIDAIVGCFAPGATVFDDGRSYAGLDEIRAWRESVASAFTYTLDVTGAELAADGAYVVSARIEGDFPGGVADLSQRFTISGDRIADLSI